MKFLKFERNLKRNTNFKFLLIFAILVAAINLIPYMLPQLENILECKIKKKISQNKIALPNESTRRIFDGKNILEEVGEFERCVEIKDCIQYTNQSNIWYSTYNSSSIIDISDQIAVKLTIKGEKDLAGINLFGKYSNEGKNWWEGRNSILISVLNEKLEIFIYTGYSRNPVQISSEIVQTDKDGYQSLIFLFNKQGKNLIISDNMGKILKKYNIDQASQSNLPNGVFAENKFNIGIEVAPSAKLSIKEFYGFRLSENNNL